MEQGNCDENGMLAEHRTKHWLFKIMRPKIILAAFISPHIFMSAFGICHLLLFFSTVLLENHTKTRYYISPKTIQLISLRRCGRWIAHTCVGRAWGWGGGVSACTNRYNNQPNIVRSAKRGCATSVQLLHWTASPLTCGGRSHTPESKRKTYRQN